MAAPERFADTPDSFPLHRGRRPYMAAPERFADTPDSFPLHRGRRPYMAHSCAKPMERDVRSWRKRTMGGGRGMPVITRSPSRRGPKRDVAMLHQDPHAKGAASHGGIIIFGISITAMPVGLC